MASVNLQKGKCGKRKALYGIPKHNYRTGQNHSNKDIDPSRTHLNKHYGPQSPAEFRERLKAMLEAADAKKPPKRVKKDRQVLLCADIPSPREGMSAEDELKWSEAQEEVMNELFPGMVVGGSYHADEIHEYTDPHDHQKHMSRGHTHWSILPWTSEKGVNMDAFYRRDLPNRINAALDVKCQELFGFNYRDGSGSKSRGSVEQLKLQSEIAELEEIKAANVFHINMQDKQIEDNQGTLQQLQEAREALQKVQERAAAAEAKLAEAERAFPRFMTKVKEWLNSLHGLERVLRTAIRLPEARREKIERRMEQEKERGGEAIQEATETVEGFMAAEDKLERSKWTLEGLKTATKENVDPEELLEDMER